MEVQAQVRLVSGSGVMSLENTTLWVDLVFKIICAKAAPLCSVPLATGSQFSKAAQLPEPLLSDHA